MRLKGHTEEGKNGAAIWEEGYYQTLYIYMIYTDFLNTDTQPFPGQFHNIKDLCHHAISLNCFSSLESRSVLLFCNAMHILAKRNTWARGIWTNPSDFTWLLKSGHGQASTAGRRVFQTSLHQHLPHACCLTTVWWPEPKKWTQAQGSHGYTEVRFKTSLFAATNLHGVRQESKSPNRLWSYTGGKAGTMMAGKLVCEES